MPVFVNVQQPLSVPALADRILGKIQLLKLARVREGGV
jgi:hypothetical protein